MQDILKRLKNEFAVKERKNYIDVTIPVVMCTNGGLIDLRIKEKEDGYKITCLSNLFLEANVSSDNEFYYKIFDKYDNDYHYDMQIKNGKVYKEYNSDQNIVVAINEFVRYFIKLDDFIINNDVIGNEKDFELK